MRKAVAWELGLNKSMLARSSYLHLACVNGLDRHHGRPRRSRAPRLLLTMDDLDHDRERRRDPNLQLCLPH
jgi:hypothetical protein